MTVRQFFSHVTAAGILRRRCMAFFKAAQTRPAASMLSPAMGERWFRQEYRCEFVDGDDGLFNRDLVTRAFSRDVEPLRL